MPEGSARKCSSQREAGQNLSEFKLNGCPGMDEVWRGGGGNDSISGRESGGGERQGWGSADVTQRCLRGKFF